MNELIPISTSGQGLPTVSGRELHRFLGNRKHFADWMKGRIKQYKLVEGQDYTSVSLNGETGGRIIEYVLTLDTAKELSMVERTERGKQARQYFIEAEKRLQQITTQPNQLLTHLDKRITDLEQKLKAVLDSQQQAARSLLDVPRSSEALPVETTRAKVQRIVNGYCRAKGVSQQNAWRLVYNRLYYLYRINIRGHKRTERESWLDVADRKGYMENIYAIVSAELTI